MKYHILVLSIFCVAQICGCTARDDESHTEIVRNGFLAIQNVRVPEQSFSDVLLSDVLAQVFKKSNDRLSECGHLGIGLTVSGVEMQRVCSFKIPELGVYDVFKYIAQQVGASVRFDDGRIYMERAK